MIHDTHYADIENMFVMDKMYNLTSAPSAAALCSLLPEEREKHLRYKEYKQVCALQSDLKNENSTLVCLGHLNWSVSSC